MKPHKKQLKTNFRIDEIAIVLVVAVLAIFVSVYEKSGNVRNIDAHEITEIMMDDHYLSFANNGVINDEKLEEIQKMDYTTLKSQLNAKNDFCVYVEDGNGGIILAKGSSKLNNDRIICRE